MISIDLHGHTLEQAMTKGHDAVGQYRAASLVRGVTMEVEFITGHGIIRNELVKLLQSYGLTPRTKLGNAGCILCDIE